MVAALAKDLVLHDLLEALFGLLMVCCDDDAFAQRQAVRLDDGRILALLLNVGQRLFRVVKHLIGGCRDVVLLHQVLCKDLAGLDLGGSLGRTKGHDALGVERIDHAGCQRIVRRHHDKVDLIFFCKADNSLDVHRVDGDALCVCADAAVARAAVNLFGLRALFEFADDGVLSAAGTDYQDFHSTSSFPM